MQVDDLGAIVPGAAAGLGAVTAAALACNGAHVVGLDLPVAVANAPDIDGVSYVGVDPPQEVRSSCFADDRGWEVPAIMAEVERARDLYFDSVSQIRMERSTSGRVALVGDAGYCASFFSAMGTSLALLGAAPLAREIEAAGDD